MMQNINESLAPHYKAIKYIKDEPTTPVEQMQRMFCKAFLTTKTNYVIITKLSSVCQLHNKSVR